MTEPKKMSVKEFREFGYLQELNRCFLHPLGLALEVIINEDGTETFGVWDGRDYPGGFTYDPDLIEIEKAARVYRERTKRETLRFQALGYVIQFPEETR